MSKVQADRHGWRPKVSHIIGAGVLVLVALGFMPLGPAPVTQSKGTSFLLKPVHPDGTVDYPTAVNDILGDGVTADTNAVIPMLRALGPELLNGEDRDEVLAELGLAELAEDGDYLIEFREYLKPHMAGAKPSLVRKRAHTIVDEAKSAPWKAGEHPLLAGWLEANPRSLAHVEEASLRTRWFIPITTDQLAKGSSPSILAIRSIGDALACKAMLDLGTGYVEEAFERAQTLHRLARLLPQTRSIIAHMIGLVLEDAASRVDIAIATKGRLSAPQAKEMLARLRSLPPWPDCRDAMDFGERCMALDILASSVRQNGGPAKGDVELDEMLKRINESFNHMIAPYDEPTYAARSAAFLATSTAETEEIMGCFQRYKGTAGVIRMILMSSWGRRRLKSRIIANVILAIGIPNLEATERANTEGATRRTLAEIALALAAHRAEKESLPEVIDVLVPGYLPEVPMDVFTGKPLRYRRDGDGYILYSVGEDMRDNGGDAKRDIVVRFGNGEAPAKRRPLK